jgi:magnesium chelatase subunit I
VLRDAGHHARELRDGGYPDRTVKQEVRANLVAGCAPVTADDRGRRLRRHGAARARAGAARRAGPDPARRARAGQDPARAPRSSSCSTRRADRRRLRDQLLALPPDLRPLPPAGTPSSATTCRSTGSTASGGSPRSSPPRHGVADLIGDVDPIKVAEGRTLGDEETIHWGLVPRHHRGIVAINELPDLPERIQVALLNVLEERDVQVRGYSLRLPLDVLLVATANPDDYTNRGRIISPLKDRFGAQVRTHYPRTIDDEIAIVARRGGAAAADVAVHVPRFLDEVLAELVRLLRDSPEVNQRSGVSVRFTIGAHETLVAGAVRRAARTGAGLAVPRVVDLRAVRAGRARAHRVRPARGGRGARGGRARPRARRA